MIDFDSIRKATESDILSYAERIVADGKLQGREYKMINPTRADNKEGSFSINIDTGLWSDFAVGAKGGDVIGLYAYINGCTQLEAAREISRMAGMSIDENKKPKKGTFTPLQPITFPDTIKHNKLGKPTLQHKYVNGYVLRFDTKEGKTYLPYNYGIYNDVEGWHFKQIENNRPLYNLDKLADCKAVILVEGEKCADAINDLIQEKSVVAVTWSGGANAYNKTDFSPLYNKIIITWADNDSAGLAAIAQISHQLANNGCDIKNIDTSQFPDKYDAADWIAEGKTKEDFRVFLRSAKPFEKQDEIFNEEVQKPTKKTEEQKAIKAKVIDIDSVISKKNQAPVIRTETAEQLPYYILGHADDCYVLYSRARGAIVRLPADKLSKSGLMHVFPNKDYWQSTFPTNNGKPDWDLAQEFIMQKCIDKGYFDDAKIRSTGAWLDNGKIVVHLGDKIYMNGQFYLPSDILSEYVYLSSAPIKIEHQRLKEVKTDKDGNERHIYESYMPEPLDDETASGIYDLITSLKWEYREAGIALAGWCAISVVGGALPWRPHIWITAQAGAGKTTVMNDIVGRLTGDMSEPIISGSTEAGLRRDLNNKTIPIIFDEAESETANTAASMERMLTLIRRSSANTRGKTKMAARAGSGTESFTSSSCFCLASIISTIRSQADATRFTVLNLMKARSAEDINHYNNYIQPKISELLTPKICDRFLMRSIVNIESILHNITVFKKAMASKGMNGRQQDQYSALLAGAYLYKSTGLIDDELAKEMVNNYNFDVFEQETTPQEQENVFMFILSTAISVKDDPSMTTRTVGWLINHIMENPFSSNDTSVMPVKSAVEVLKEKGIKVCHETRRVYFFRTSPAIQSWVKYNPQWYNWAKILLNDEEKNFKTENKSMRFGSAVGYSIYADFAFFEQGVSFQNIKPRIHQEEENQPF